MNLTLFIPLSFNRGVRKVKPHCLPRFFTFFQGYSLPNVGMKSFFLPNLARKEVIKVEFGKGVVLILTREDVFSYVKAVKKAIRIAIDR